MADVRISELPTTGTIGLTDELETNTAGGAPSVRRTVAQILAAAFVNTAPALGWYSPSADTIRTPNSVIVDDNVTGGAFIPTGTTKPFDGMYSLGTGNVGISTNDVLALDITENRIRVTGGVLVGAGTAAVASMQMPHGVAPSSPTNGDMWTTAAGLFVRINGATVGPLS